MKNRRAVVIVAVALLAAGALAPAPVGAAPGAITEYDLSPGFNVPRDITTGRDGNMWFTELVGDRIGRIRSGGSGGPAAPGVHGTGLGTVTVKPGGQTLAQGGAVDIKASPNLSFDIQVMNQGENDENDVPVKVSITGAGKPIVVQQRLPSIAAGQSKTVSLPLAAAPPTGRPVTVTVQIVGVPGEKNLDNNKGTFAAVFTQ